jgi:hypothetical protein
MLGIDGGHPLCLCRTELEPKITMKLQKPILLFTAILAVLTAVPAHAKDIIQTITISVMALPQNSGTSTATTTNIPPAKASNHTTPEFLSRLAQDEFAEGFWASNSFPADARLAVVPSQGNNADFAVILGTNILVDVSDIISFESDNIEIVSGAQSLQTGLASPSTKKVHLGQFSFDDSSAGNPNGSWTFTLQGIFTETVVDTVPKNGVYTETRTAKMTSGTGDGTNPGGPFVCTGSISATGKAVLPAP